MTAVKLNSNIIIIIIIIIKIIIIIEIRWNGYQLAKLLSLVLYDGTLC